MEKAKKNVLIIFNGRGATPIDRKVVAAALSHCKSEQIDHSIDHSKPTNVSELVEQIKTHHFVFQKNTGPLIILHHGKKLASLGKKFRHAQKGAAPVKILDLSLFSRVMEKSSIDSRALFKQVLSGFIGKNLS